MREFPLLGGFRLRRYQNFRKWKTDPRPIIASGPHRICWNYETNIIGKPVGLALSITLRIVEWRRIKIMRKSESHALNLPKSYAFAIHFCSGTQEAHSITLFSYILLSLTNISRTSVQRRRRKLSQKKKVVKWNGPLPRAGDYDSNRRKWSLSDWHSEWP